MRIQKVSTQAALSAAVLVSVLGLAACSSTTSTADGGASAEPAATSAPAATSTPAQGSTQNASVEGSYISLEDYESNKAKYADSDVVLFFNASWCSTCREANKNLTGSKGDFPNGLTVVNVDYDSNNDLRKKYGVTTQHTFVLVAPDGTEIKKWTGSNSVNQIEAKV